MVSRKVSRKSHRRLGETEAAELKAARRLVKEEDARKARGAAIEAGPPCAKKALRAEPCPLQNEAGLQQELREDFLREGGEEVQKCKM